MGYSSTARTFGAWRTLPALAVGALATLLSSAGLLACPSRLRSRAFVDRLLYFWSRSWLLATGARIEVEGLEHLDRVAPCVVVSNHQSNLDPMVYLASFRGSIRILTKRELFSVPLLGAALRVVGMVEVDRTGPDRDAIGQAAAHTLAQGLPVLVFPEGTTSRDGELLPFKDGAFEIAVATGVPLLPAAVINSRDVWPGKRLTIRPGTVRLILCEPVLTDHLTREDVPELRARVWELLASTRRRAVAGRV